MLTGEIRNQVDKIWDAFWSGGVSNPLSVIEQITYLLFIQQLEEIRLVVETSTIHVWSPHFAASSPSRLPRHGYGTRQ
ncbi:type I restriction-modification system subunit M N-terminal domain-containing protein [Methylocystis sp. IM3]|uniref:type I restriction-modification system subunit M N-terminal domain-containing protein n=1 Tax=unclassified Methylocystis TaxID=2625913 RepID=UPI0030FB796B